MYGLDLKQGNYPIIIRPNLGQPVLVNLRDFKGEEGNYFKNIVFFMYIIAIPGQSKQEILEFFYLNLYIQPILTDEGDFAERRGERHPVQLLEIEELNRNILREQDLTSEDNCIVWDINNSLAKIDKLFGERTDIYKVKLQIKNIKV